LKLLVELMGLLLVKLALLLEEGVIGSLVKLSLYLRRRWFSTWWICVLRGRGFHRMVPQYFFCKCQTKSKCQCK
jgi:hypothetical protein